MSDRVLLVGGNGFIGRALCGSLLARGRSVRVFDRPLPVGLAAPDGVEFSSGDIADDRCLKAAMEDCRELVYLAQETVSSPYLDPDSIAVTRNLELFLGTMRAGIENGLKRIVLFSSGGAVYGKAQAQPVRESCHLQPISAYGVAKASMEKYLYMCSEVHGVQYLIVRPSTLYGPGQNFLRKQGVIAAFLHRVAQGMPLEVWGDGTATKDYLFIDDLAEAVARLVEIGYINCPFNVGSGAGKSIKNIIDEIATVTGIRPAVEYRSANKNDVPVNILDCSSLRLQTEWQPTVDLREGIKRTWKWIQTQ
jgi:UDP-glucose 4-epimerase